MQERELSKPASVGPARAARLRLAGPAFGLAALCGVLALGCGALFVAAGAAYPAQYRAETRVFVAAPAGSQAPLDQAAAMMLSRDIARDALSGLGAWGRPEFARNDSEVARALETLGALDPDRDGAQERALTAFAARLSVAALPRERQLLVGFRAEDADFAARAANRVAALFLAARADAERAAAAADAETPDLAPSGRTAGAASVVVPAVPPAHALAPDSGLAFGAAGLFAAALALAALGRWARRGAQDGAPEAPRPLGLEGAILQTHGFVSARLGAGDPGEAAAARNARALEDAAARILKRRGPGPARIFAANFGVGAGFGASVPRGPDVALALARRLSAEGRSILVDLGELSPAGFARGAGDAPGLAELIAHEARFEEAIRRDGESRLHMVSRGAAPLPVEALAAGAELSIVLDALAGAYDFIWLKAGVPAEDELFRALAAEADLVVLAAAPGEPRAESAARPGFGWRARDVLVIGSAQAPARSLSLGAA